MNHPRIALTGAQRLLLLLIVVLPSLVRLIGIDRDLLGDDEWRETETATIARHFLTEPDILYPRINWGAPGPGYVEAEFQLFPFGVQLLYRAFGVHAWLGRALAVALGALATLLMYRLARHLLRPNAALLAAFSFASAPLVFRFGRAFMPEATVLVFYVLAAERFAQWLADGRWRTIVTAALALMLAILVKPTSVHLGLLAIGMAWRQGGLRRAFGPQMLTFGAIALVPAIAYFAHAASLHLTYGNSFGVISGGDSKWGNTTWWFDPKFYRTLQYIDVVYGMGYTGSLLAVLAMLFGRPRALRATLVGWLMVVFLYYLIVARYAGHESRGIQYHVYVIVPLSLATAGGASMVRNFLCERLRGRQWLVLAICAVPIFGMAVQQWRSNLRFLHMPIDDTFWRAGRALAAVSAADDCVIVTSTDRAVDDGATNNFEEPKVMFHAWRRGRILARDRLDAAHLDDAIDQTGARFVVVLDEVMAGAKPDFRAAIATFELAAEGPGFHVYRLGGH